MRVNSVSYNEVCHCYCYVICPSVHDLSFGLELIPGSTGHPGRDARPSQVAFTRYFCLSISSRFVRRHEIWWME